MEHSFASFVIIRQSPTLFLHLALSHLQASAQLTSAVLQGHAPRPLFCAHMPEQEQFTLEFCVSCRRKKEYKFSMGCNGHLKYLNSSLPSYSFESSA